MKNAFLSGLRQALGVRFFLAVLVFVLLIAIASIQSILQILSSFSLLPNGYHTEFLLNALSSETIISFLPIVSVLPFSAAYVDDIKSKFARFFCVRSSYNAYAFSRIGVCFFSGGFAVGVGVIIAWGILSFLFMPLEMKSGNASSSTEMLLQVCILISICGGLWAVIGMTMSTLMESKYIAYASPFVVYYLLVILYERYFTGAYLIYPPNWISPEVWPYGAWSAAVFLLELSTIFILLFVFRASRRLKGI